MKLKYLAFLTVLSFSATLPSCVKKKTNSTSRAAPQKKTADACKAAKAETDSTIAQAQLGAITGVKVEAESLGLRLVDPISNTGCFPNNGFSVDLTDGAISYLWRAVSVTNPQKSVPNTRCMTGAISRGGKLYFQEMFDMYGQTCIDQLEGETVKFYTIACHEGVCNSKEKSHPPYQFARNSCSKDVSDALSRIGKAKNLLKGKINEYAGDLVRRSCKVANHLRITKSKLQKKNQTMDPYESKVLEMAQNICANGVTNTAADIRVNIETIGKNMETMENLSSTNTALADGTSAVDAIENCPPGSGTGTDDLLGPSVDTGSDFGSDDFSTGGTDGVVTGGGFDDGSGSDFGGGDSFADDTDSSTDGAVVDDAAFFDDIEDALADTNDDLSKDEKDKIKEVVGDGEDDGNKKMGKMLLAVGVPALLVGGGVVGYNAYTKSQATSKWKSFNDARTAFLAAPDDADAKQKYNTLVTEINGDGAKQLRTNMGLGDTKLPAADAVVSQRAAVSGQTWYKLADGDGKVTGYTTDAKAKGTKLTSDQVKGLMAAADGDGPKFRQAAGLDFDSTKVRGSVYEGKLTNGIRNKTGFTPTGKGKAATIGALAVGGFLTALGVGLYALTSTEVDAYVSYTIDVLGPKVDRALELLKWAEAKELRLNRASN